MLRHEYPRENKTETESRNFGIKEAEKGEGQLQNKRSRLNKLLGGIKK